MSKFWLSISALAAGAALLLAFNVVAGRTLRTARVDLTEGRLYTLSPGARRIAASLPEPVRLTFYFSEKATTGRPEITTYAARVRELLQELARASAGKIELREVDPQPFSEDEDRAVENGLAGLPVTETDRAYFGLVGSNAVDRREVVPFFDPSKEPFLEYELTRLVYLLSDPPRKVVGVMSWLPLKGAQSNPFSGGGAPPWAIYTELGQVFELREIQTTAAEIPEDVQVLLVVHPKAMSERTQYAVDQFVLRGGRALVFVDPLCEADVPPGLNPMQAMSIPKASGLDRLLGAWGLQMDGAKVAADRGSGIRVGVGSQGRPEDVTYVAWLLLRGPRLNGADPVCAGLDALLLKSAGALRKKDGSGLEITPLVSTTAAGSTVEAASLSVYPDPKKLLAEYKPGSEPITLAARVTGPAKSAFPDGPPKADPAKPDEPPPAPPKTSHLAESKGPVGVIVVADCDLLADSSWVQEQRIGNLSLGRRKITSNGDLVVGMVDNLSGSTDLLTLRARGTSSREFTRVADLRRDAEQRFRQKEDELQQRLQATMGRINELQTKRPDKSDAGLVLSADQKKELDELQRTMVSTRKELRDVKFQLNKDIDALGATVKAVNIGLMPALVGLAALGLGSYRAARRNADRRNASRG